MYSFNFQGAQSDQKSVKDSDDTNTEHKKRIEEEDSNGQFHIRNYVV